MPTADLRKFRKSTLSVEARSTQGNQVDQIVTQKIKKPAELEAKLREIHIDTTSPIEHGLSERAREKAHHSLGKFPPTGAGSANGQERAFPHAHQSIINLVVYSAMGKKNMSAQGRVCC